MSLAKSDDVQSEDLGKLSDDELTRQITEGRQDAMALLFDRYHHLVFDVALRIVRDPGEAPKIFY